MPKLAELMQLAEAPYRKQNVPSFQVGDAVEVRVRIMEGGKSRVQPFQGMVIGRRGRGLNEMFTVRRIVAGEGVERTFPLHSPSVEGVEVLRRGLVRRAKLYYLRGRVGKATRIRERREPLAVESSRQVRKAGAARTRPDVIAEFPRSAEIVETPQPAVIVAPQAAPLQVSKLMPVFRLSIKHRARGEQHDIAITACIGSDPVFENFLLDPEKAGLQPRVIDDSPSSADPLADSTACVEALRPLAKRLRLYETQRPMAQSQSLPLLLEIASPRGYLPLIHWERVLLQVLGRPIVRRPAFPFLRLPFSGRLRAALCLPEPEKAPKATPTAWWKELILAWLGPQKSAAVVDVFTTASQHATLERELADCISSNDRPGVRLHAAKHFQPATSETRDAFSPLRSDWLLWMRQKLSGGVDVVHFQGEGRYTLGLGQFDLAASPSGSANPPWTRYLDVQQLTVFLNQVGAWSFGCTSSSARSSPGLRQLADELARVRLGPVVVHEAEMDPHAADLRAAYQALLTQGTEAPQLKAVILYGLPQTLEDLESSSDAEEAASLRELPLGDAVLQALGDANPFNPRKIPPSEASRGAPRIGRKEFPGAWQLILNTNQRETGEPAWKAAVRSCLLQTATDTLTHRPQTAEEEAEQQGIADGLQFLSELLLESHSVTG
jgi:large subunit ribosomal protein L19